MNNSIPLDIKEKIVKLISAIMPNVKIILFGSRARNTASKWSDIDIALDAGKPLSNTKVDEIKSILQATNIPYKIEIVDFHMVTEQMKQSISKEGIAWKS
jgi:predicted nucleotidyltransferase